VSVWNPKICREYTERNGVHAEIAGKLTTDGFGEGSLFLLSGAHYFAASTIIRNPIEKTAVNYREIVMVDKGGLRQSKAQRRFQ
jgi:hypothetical protein